MHVNKLFQILLPFSLVIFGKGFTEPAGIGKLPSLERDTSNIMKKNMLDVLNGGNLKAVLGASAVNSSWSKVLSDIPFDSKTRMTCSKDLMRLTKAFFSGEKWTISFVDSAGKPGPSVSRGWLTFIGNYDLCQEAAAPATALAAGFRGEYFALTISTSIPLLTSRLDLCLPDTCTEPEIASIAGGLLNTSTNTYGLGILSVGRIKNETEVTTATVCCIVVLSILVCLVFLGTGFDLVLSQNNSPSDESAILEKAEVKGEEIMSEKLSVSKNYKTMSDNIGNSSSESKDTSNKNADNKKLARVFVRFCLPFSTYRNGKEIFTVRQNDKSLNSIHGLRFLSCCWVILAHTYSVISKLDVTLNKNTALLELKDRWTFGPVANAFLSVDTFFVVSGLLVAFHTMNGMNKNGWKIDWVRFYLHRYWRLTPPYMLVLLTSMGLTQYFGGGPVWMNKQPIDKELCEDKWWKNMLYISNFDSLFDECMGHGWFLACNMQFFFLSPLMVVPFFFHHAAGIVSCFVFLITSLIVTGVLSSVNDWSPNGFLVFDSISQRDEYMGDFYVKPWCRIGPFVIGIIAGYILTKTKGRSFKIQWWVVALGWLVSTATALAVVYGLHGDISGRHPSSTGVVALYNSVARTAWGVSISWIILACDAGYGGPVNAILSWSPFEVLGRLSYMMYLAHPAILFIVFQNSGYPMYYTDYTHVTMYLGYVTFSTFCSFFLVLLFESPMGKLEDLFFPKR